MKFDPIQQSFFGRDPAIVARELLGMILCRRNRQGLAAGRIVETEAYLAKGDSASHSFRGLGRKSASMFAPAVTSQVCTIHARQCFNVVTEMPGVGSVVLIRAIQPLHGIPLMQQRRGIVNSHDLCSSPARLCQALDIGRKFGGWNLPQGRQLWIAGPTDNSTASSIGTSQRIGVTSNTDMLLRFLRKIAHSSAARNA